ncbi:LAFE_0G15610g1_1 [Lachancea fermentati]|uniref:S-adenosylmethionine decarboxylase proenzyme n=1 Tax=Lachancea fermentati TaxID=4955 RepID=A0A1G4MIE3_LACFM|nr:LAFE_0G15610g1_1 [Lachancea fermentati]
MTVSISELSNHTYIDRKLSMTLDSTDAFEGPEKLLEIWFYPNVQSIPDGTKTLRSIAFEKWIHILELVKCQVLSMKKAEKMDAFLLSESSLFVFDHKLTLKTCGTTTTLFCLEDLFRIVKEDLGWDFSCEGKNHPYKAFYSRRRFMFPLKQRSIHKNWSDEVEYLNSFFCFGKSYLVGRLDQANHWNLYVTETNTDLKTYEDEYPDDDETLEILMTGLEPSKSNQFVVSRESSDVDNCGSDDAGHVLGLRTTQATKLDSVYDNVRNVSIQHDAFAFTPCGYSSNVVMDGQFYYTLHVTPENGWSYASFESNVPVKHVSKNSQDNIEVMKRVLDVFRPADFCLTFFVRNIANDNFGRLMKLCDEVPGYSKKDKIIYDLDDYHLLYLRYARIPEKV